ncbi:hypothetical protein LCGC14_0397100 [marine sediment metagenome]|uniref:Uncharacterized protein n=1 Tax=marine sediment metagenome TaxID=412755 RepID=A0A0F9TFZ2_9ZZZZ
MSGGSFNYAFERPPYDWGSAMDHLELVLLRAQARRWVFNHVWDSGRGKWMPFFTPTICAAGLRFIDLWFKGQGDPYANPVKASEPLLATPEAIAIVKAVEWWASGDWGPEAVIEAIVKWEGLV